MDRAAIETRLATLHAEAAKGQQVLAQLDAQRGQLRDALLRIDGATQVLQELLAADAPTDAPVPAEVPAADELGPE